MKLPKDSIIDYIPISAFDLDKVAQKEVIKSNINLTMKEHLKSFLITFIVSFAIVLVAQVDNISLESFKDGAIFGLIFGASRAGVKAVLELLILKFS